MFDITIIKKALVFDKFIYHKVNFVNDIFTGTYKTDINKTKALKPHELKAHLHKTVQILDKRTYKVNKYPGGKNYYNDYNHCCYKERN